MLRAAMALLSRQRLDDAQQALKSSIGCLVAMWIVIRWHLPYGMSAVLTVHVLLTLHRRQSLTDGILRIMGPVAFCSIMILSLLIVPRYALFTITLAAVLICFAVAHYVEHICPYAGIYAAISVGLIASVASGGANDAINFAIHWILALILGVVIVFLITCTIYPHLSPGFAPKELQYRSVYPLQLGSAARVARVTAAMMIVLLLVIYFNLPGGTAAFVTVTAVSVVPTVHAAHDKIVQRGLGALAGTVYGVLILNVLSHVPSIPMLLLLSAIGFFASAFISTLSPRLYYPAAQAGIVLAIVLLEDQGTIGSLNGAFQRVTGVVVGGAAALLTSTMPWPLLPWRSSALAKVPS
jgi:uncharacterized membrane protein YccC